MANPSTGFGGAGTEVLRRGYVDNFSSTEITLLTGVANHIYTVLSIIFLERGGADKAIHMYIDADLGGADIMLLSTQPIGAEETFVWNDRFVITETDKLHAVLTSAGAMDAWITYIDQQLA